MPSNLLIFALVTIFSFSDFQSANADCTIRINGGLGDPQTLILKQRQSSYLDTFLWPSNRFGFVNLKENEVALLACPGGHLVFGTHHTTTESVEVKCSNKKFEIVQIQLDNFNGIKCSKMPVHIARFTRYTCLRQFNEIEVGFDVTNYGFLRQMLVCFDPIWQSTVYTKFEMTKHINGFQYNFPRIRFIQGSMFYSSIPSVDKLYERGTQRATINGLLGLPATSLKYINNGDNYLSRGHLVAKSDHVYGSQQLSTFYYINAAPQWYLFNEGNWNILERSTRFYASWNEVDLTVYTGTHGIATLPHERTGRQIGLFLHVSGNQRSIPIPEVFWKVVYDPKSQNGVAFVGVNNPFRTGFTELCRNICNQLTWVHFEGGADPGYSYCCEVDDLRNAIKTIPNFPVRSLLTADYHY